MALALTIYETARSRKDAKKKSEWDKEFSESKKLLNWAEQFRQHPKKSKDKRAVGEAALEVGLEIPVRPPRQR